MRSISIICAVFLWSCPVFSSEKLTEVEFIKAVKLRKPEEVERMDGRRFWMTAYIYSKKIDGQDVLLCRPLGMKAEIRVEFCCDTWDQEIRQALKKQSLVKYTFAGNAHTKVEAKEPDGILTSEEYKRWQEQNGIRLWKFSVAKKVIPVSQAARRY